MSTPKVNFKAKVTAVYESTFINSREVGEEIYVHLFDDGKVLLYSPSVRGRNSKPVFDVIVDSIEEAKKYCTCTASTDFDVRGSWDTMMSDRYF